MDGRLLALKLNKQFPGWDWMAEVAEKAGETRDKVEWHFQEDMEPPANIERAALELSNSSPEDSLQADF